MRGTTADLFHLNHIESIIVSSYEVCRLRAFASSLTLFYCFYDDYNDDGGCGDNEYIQSEGKKTTKWSIWH